MSDGFKFWGWVNETIVGMLFYAKRYTGHGSTRRDRHYLVDMVSYRVGHPRLRQVRVPPGKQMLAALLP